MIGVLQRVSDARVDIEGETIGKIGKGLLVYIAFERDDTEHQADHLLRRLFEYRVFPDATGKMNLSLKGVLGSLLLVPQFTLAADTRTGTRPSFSPAAPPPQGRLLYEYMINAARADYGNVACGKFGTDMKVVSTNDGPVTFILRTAQDRQ